MNNVAIFAPEIFLPIKCFKKKNRQISGISEAASVLRYLAVLGGVSIFKVSQ